MLYLLTNYYYYFFLLIERANYTGYSSICFFVVNHQAEKIDLVS